MAERWNTHDFDTSILTNSLWAILAYIDPTLTTVIVNEQKSRKSVIRKSHYSQSMEEAHLRSETCEGPQTEWTIELLNCWTIGRTNPERIFKFTILHCFGIDHY